jgi:hypothetical protein
LALLSSHTHKTTLFLVVFDDTTAASNADKTQVELVTPPAEAKVGSLLRLDGVDDADWTPDASVNGKKKNHAWMQCVNSFKLVDGVPSFNGHAFVVNGQQCTVANLQNGNIA